MNPCHEAIGATRSSEKASYRKVIGVYATSVDYDKDSELSQQFFRAAQNKLHWAAHGRTAAELIAERADATKPNMGLTSWSGAQPRRADVVVAKNYLTPDELTALDRIVAAFLTFAELQAEHRPMSMADWARKLDEYLKLAERDVIEHSYASAITHDDAAAKARQQLDQYEQRAILRCDGDSNPERRRRADVVAIARPRAARPERRRRGAPVATAGTAA